MEINIEDIGVFYNHLNHEKETEIRAIIPGGEVKSHFVHSEKEFIEVCKQLNGRFNIYVGINERTPNGKEDDDVEMITCIGHDLDCHDDNSSLAVAAEVANTMKEDFIKINAKAPMILFSGAGYWVVHFIEPITNTEENESKIKLFGAKMKERFEKPGVDLDSKVYNPSRIARVPGTINIKNNKLARIIYNPPMERDEGLVSSIMEIDIKPKKKFILKNIPKGDCTFLDYCITHEIPKGERHSVISKNVARYIYGKLNCEELKQTYIESQNGNSNDLDGWFKSLKDNPENIGNVNHDELMEFQKKYNVPFKCVNCPLDKNSEKNNQPKGWNRSLSIFKIADKYNMNNCPKCNNLFKLNRRGLFYCEHCSFGGSIKKLLKLYFLKQKAELK